MCNLYSITTNQAAIIELFRVIHHYVGNLPPAGGRPEVAEPPSKRRDLDPDQASSLY
jgi:hypothetical protein